MTEERLNEISSNNDSVGGMIEIDELVDEVRRLKLKVLCLAKENGTMKSINGYKKFLQAIKDCMQYKNISYRDLAKKMGMDHAHLYRLLNYQKRMYLDQAIALCKVLNMDLDIFSKVGSGSVIRPSKYYKSR